jgi:hypothetical protein
VDGRDPRFTIAGTKAGRLSADVEQQIRAEVKAEEAYFYPEPAYEPEPKE